MPYLKLIGKLANPAATVICAAFLYRSDLATQEKIEGQLNEVKNDLQGQINDVKVELAKGINQAQLIAAGAPLILVNDPKKIPAMQGRLKAFAACVRGGGGEGCSQMPDGIGPGKGPA